MDSTASGSTTAAATRGKEDCLGCRLTGTMTLAGLSSYFLFERSKLPRHDHGQRRWLLLCSSAFAVAGLWRATTGLFPIKPQQNTPPTATA